MHCECLLDSEGVTPNPWSGDSNFGGVLVIGTVLQPPKPKYPSSACHIDTTPAQSDTAILITDAMTSCCEPWRQLEHPLLAKERLTEAAVGAQLQPLASLAPVTQLLHDPEGPKGSQAPA